MVRSLDSLLKPASADRGASQTRDDKSPGRCAAWAAVLLSHVVKGAAALAAAVDDGPVQLEPSSVMVDA